MSQGTANKISERSASSGLLVRLANDGDSICGVFRGEVHIRWVIWTGKRYEAAGVVTPSPNVLGREKKLRMSFNFYVPAEKAMKVIEGGRPWFREVIEKTTKFGADTWIFRIERHGAARDPRTIHAVTRYRRIDADLRAEIEAAKLHDLKAFHGEVRPQRPSLAATRTLPFISAEAAGALVARLKGLPRPLVEQFLSTFGVSRVRDLRANQEAAARAFIGDHEPQPQFDFNPFE